MNLAEHVADIWTENQSALEARICGWIRDIESNRSFISKSRKSFHEWAPLRTYINVTNAKKKGAAVFSVRFIGQEVATVIVNKSLDVQLRVNETQAKWNSKYFGLRGKSFTVKWDSPQAKTFRDAFRKLSAGRSKVKTHSPEHQVETYLIGEMRKNSRANKFGGRFSGIQPVMFERCPFQLSTPISGNTGIPHISPRGGNMDIVARRRARGNKVRISIWELKKPNMSGSAINKAICQAIIYASTLRMMLRSQCGADWYRLLGFTNKMPQSLEIEAVVTLSSDDRAKYEKQISKAKEAMPLLIDRDLIIPCGAFYNDKCDVEHFEQI